MNWLKKLFPSATPQIRKPAGEASSFEEYAAATDLSADEIYTIELLIERVRDKFEVEDWDEWTKRGDARETPGYKPHFLPAHIVPAGKVLQSLEWVSFQRLRDAERPVRSLTALRYLPKITGLAVVNNEVSDLSPLRSCTALRQLDLNKNPIRDLAPIEACRELESLDVRDMPLESFSALRSLPKLQSLSLSSDQLDAFCRLDRLPALQTLELGTEMFDSFKLFPEMPEIRVIRGAHVRQLVGLERFPTLENLVNLSGEFDSLEPLRSAKRLTHANILGSRIRSLEPLSGIWTLRELYVATESADLDLQPLEALPALHKLRAKCSGKEPPDLARLQATLPSWDVEFRVKTPRYTPSLTLEVVTKETFDLYDGRQPYNLTDSDTNKALLSSELSWLDDHLETLFAPDFESGKDFEIPFNWPGARSRTVVLQSNEAIEAFPRLVLGMQRILAHAKMDWIIYLQSVDAEPEFVVWVYPNKVVVAESGAEVVKSLMRPT